MGIVEIWLLLLHDRNKSISLVIFYLSFIMINPRKDYDTKKILFPSKATFVATDATSF